MLITLDTEFLEDGHTIEMISIALVAEDGHYMYYVNADADWTRISQDPWIVDNVLRPHIPMADVGYAWQPGMTWYPHPEKNLLLPKRTIAHDVEAFIRDREPELWANYSATDHVVGYQLFGSMIEASRDHGWPMRTNCLAQEEESLKRTLRGSVGAAQAEVIWEREHSDMRPVQDPETVHHALFDARFDMQLARWLELTP